MFECKVPQSVHHAYSMLEEILVGSNCKIIAKESPLCIRVSQGSLFGVTPMGAKKLVSFDLCEDGSQTKIVSSTKISSDWKNLTLYGNLVTGFVIGLFVWIAFDMSSYIETAKPGFWVWIAQLFESSGMRAAILVSNLFQVFAVFLVFVVLIEILIVIYVYPRKNVFSQHVLDLLSTKD